MRRTRLPVAAAIAAAVVGATPGGATGSAVPATGSVESDRTGVGPRAAARSSLGERVLVAFDAQLPAADRAAVVAAAGARAAAPSDALGVQVLTAASPADAVLRLRGARGVRWAEREVRFRRSAEATSTPERDELGFEAAATASGGTMRGNGVTVAVIDDGVDPGNPDLSAPGKVVDGGDFTGAPGATGLTPSGDHGTAVAAIIAAEQGNGTGIVGGAPAARIASYRVFADEGNAGSPGIRAAILRAVSDGAAVINLSLGGPFRSRAVTEAIEHARASDVVTVVASGNDGTERPNFPAADRGVISVGASQQVSPGVWSVAPFSNGGSVDVIAPGVDVLTWARDPVGGSQLRWLDGTSFAAPHVAAIAAGLAATGVRGDRARAAITAAAEARAGGQPYRSGAGRADAATSYAVATGTTPYTGVFVPDGHTVANDVGRRTIEAIRWDPAVGDADDGPPTVAVTAGSVGAPSAAQRDIGTGRLHTVLTPYQAPTGGNATTSVDVVAGRPGDVAERLPLRVLAPTIGPEGVPLPSGTTVTAALVRGTESSYVRAVDLPSGPRFDVTYDMPDSAQLAELLVWAPTQPGGVASSHDVPVDGAPAPGPGTLRFPSGAASTVAYPAGRYVVGFLLDPHDELGPRQVPFAADDGVYTLRLDTPAGVALIGATTQLVSDVGTASAFVPRWTSRSTGVRYDVEWTQRYRDAAGRWYIGAWRPWSEFEGTTRTSGSFGVEGGTRAEQTKTYFLRVRAHDAVGNVSAWSAFKQYVVPVDDRYAYVRYGAGWLSRSSATAYLGTLRTTTAATSFTLAADTAGFTLVGERCPSCGLLRVRVDGGPWRSVDTWAATTRSRQQLHYTGSFGAIGRHTLEVQTLATPGRPRVSVDAIAVIR